MCVRVCVRVFVCVFVCVRVCIRDKIAAPQQEQAAGGVGGVCV